MIQTKCTLQEQHSSHKALVLDLHVIRSSWSPPKPVSSHFPLPRFYLAPSMFSWCNFHCCPASENKASVLSLPYYLHLWEPQGEMESPLQSSMPEHSQDLHNDFSRSGRKLTASMRIQFLFSFFMQKLHPGAVNKLFECKPLIHPLTTSVDITHLCWVSLKDKVLVSIFMKVCGWEIKSVCFPNMCPTFTEEFSWLSLWPRRDQ